MSNFVTGGDTSEKLSKEFRRPLSTEAKIDEFSQFSIPDISHLQVYLRKYPSFRQENVPFFLFEPSRQELEDNASIERRKKEEKEKNLRKKSSKRDRLIVFQGEPGPSNAPSQNQAGPSRAYENIEDALDGALAGRPDPESDDEENEDPVILEYIQNQINQQNNDEEYANFDDRQIEFVGEDQDENINNPIYEFAENDDDDAHYINLIDNLPQKRSRKKPSRFDDYQMDQ